MEYENTHGLSKKEFNEYKSLILSQLQVHHVVPLSGLGTNGENNIVCVCENCHNKIHEETDTKVFKSEK